MCAVLWKGLRARITSACVVFSSLESGVLVPKLVVLPSHGDGVFPRMEQIRGNGGVREGGMLEGLDLCLLSLRNDEPF